MCPGPGVLKPDIQVHVVLEVKGNLDCKCTFLPAFLSQQHLAQLGQLQAVIAASMGSVPIYFSWR